MPVEKSTMQREVTVDITFNPKKLTRKDSVVVDTSVAGCKGVVYNKPKSYYPKNIALSIKSHFPTRL